MLFVCSKQVYIDQTQNELEGKYNPMLVRLARLFSITITLVLIHTTYNSMYRKFAQVVSHKQLQTMFGFHKLHQIYIGPAVCSHVGKHQRRLISQINLFGTLCLIVCGLTLIVELIFMNMSVLISCFDDMVRIIIFGEKMRKKNIKL